MKSKLIYFFLLFYAFFFNCDFFAQKLTLQLTSIHENEAKILQQIKYKQKHKDSLSLITEINKTSINLKKMGYLTNSIDSIKKMKNNFMVYFTLNKKIDAMVLKIKPEFRFLLKDLKSDSLTIPIKEIENTLLTISNKLEKQGKPFSKVRLKNLNIKNKKLIAELDLSISKKRHLNKVVIKGYENFPKSLLKNHFKIKEGTIFHQQKINQISNDSESLKFIQVIKPPEILFTKDSTLLYLYFKKKINNSFDGIINFSSEENGDLLFNGNIDLKLNNTFNKGEKLELYWNSIGQDRQEFRLTSETPYLFNSKFTPKILFNIYKQDSTFLNTTFNIKLFYNFNSKSKIALNYDSTSSENLTNNTSTNLETFNNYFLGFAYNYTIAKNDFFLNDKFHFEITHSLGKRQANQSFSNQYKIETLTTYIWDFNNRNSFYIKNKIGYLNSTNYLTNELFRIGGPKSIRGFNEQSIFTKQYTYFNTEYRLLTNNDSYIYSIADFGYINATNYLSFGLGYCFTKNKSVFNINSVVGSKNATFNLSNIQLNINWVTFF